VAEVEDGYETYYAERVWQLLPAVYRTADTDSLDAAGPLRELIDRIGAQVAVVRRSIDRLWADQSIETCDDWVIPYIGDLLGTNLVNAVDPRGQRVDVAKTIHYRRHKGTLQVLEELAADVTGWSGHVGEGFRRLARTRHGLDPPVGSAAFPTTSPSDVGQLLQIEGLSGLLTATPAGGFADLRSPHGSALTNTAFDESFHTADLRRGQGACGHFGIPKLLVFVWRLGSFPVVGGSPVAVAGTTNEYAFDPTGREVPLFLPPAPPVDDFSEAWAPAREWQVPGPLSASLERAIDDTGSSPPLPPRPPYPDTHLPRRYSVGGGGQPASISPERGRFATTSTAPATLTVDYQYGFSSAIGAGPYDRDLLGDPPAVPAPEHQVAGGNGLDTALAAGGATGTITIADSLTYAALGQASDPIDALLVRAGPSQRPVLRPPAGASPWVFTGRPGAQLVLDGLTVSGCDIVLRGAFDTVRLTACTVDPGTSAPGSPPLAAAVDGRSLAPSRIFVEADPAAPQGQPAAIGALIVDHCILGPIRTRLGGSVETLTITDSIVQGIPASTGMTVFDPLLLAQGLLSGRSSQASQTPAFPPSAAILGALPGLVAPLEAYLAEPLSAQQSGLPPSVIGSLGALISGPSIYSDAAFGAVDLSPGVSALANASLLDGAHLAALNRGLLEDAFPIALAPAAVAVAGASLQLSRVTVLGRVAAKRLAAGDSILGDFTTTEDAQDGCVRFSAYAGGSVVPRHHESVAIPAGAPIFTSTAYGNPGYAQLLETADAAIVTADRPAGSISSGAENGSEMGAFCADLNPVKEQGLLVKYGEYMPLGLAPVIVHVT
jgi:hypothetical protein